MIPTDEQKNLYKEEIMRVINFWKAEQIKNPNNSNISRALKRAENELEEIEK